MNDDDVQLRITVTRRPACWTFHGPARVGPFSLGWNGNNCCRFVSNWSHSVAYRTLTTVKVLETIVSVLPD